MGTGGKSQFSLLRTKEIIGMLDGDAKFGTYKLSDGQDIDVSMPYLSGIDIINISIMIKLLTALQKLFQQY